MNDEWYRNGVVFYLKRWGMSSVQVCMRKSASEEDSLQLLLTYSEIHALIKALCL